jgi:type VI secretion system protein ImpF
VSTQRLTPSLFDKVVADTQLSGLRGEDKTPEITREAMRFYSVPKLERFNEAALRATIRRDLAWLLNTTNYGAIEDLEAYPHVATSVLNFGVPDLAGKSFHTRTIQHRAREIRNAIRTFEPRINPETLMVEPVGNPENPNAITFIIHGDITSAAQAMPVKFRTELEADTAAVQVSE